MQWLDKQPAGSFEARATALTGLYGERFAV